MKKFTTEQFLNKAKEIHNDKYDYSKVIYVTTKIKVTIICPIHGEFEQLPSAHMLGRGCDKCARKENKIKSRNTQLKNQEEYIQELVKIHGDKLIFTSCKKPSLSLIVKRPILISLFPTILTASSPYFVLKHSTNSERTISLILLVAACLVKVESVKSKSIMFLLLFSKNFLSPLKIFQAPIS